MKKLLLLLPALLLTACTDIRTRLSPDLLAADTGTELRLAAHTTQDDTLITAYAAAPELPGVAPLPRSSRKEPAPSRRKTRPALRWAMAAAAAVLSADGSGDVI